MGYTNLVLFHNRIGVKKELPLYCLSDVPCEKNVTKTTRNERRRKTIHHVFAQNRFGSLRNCDWNKVECSRGAHELLHIVFENKTPGESIALLRRYFCLVEDRSRVQAIDFLERTYWRDLFTVSDDPMSIWFTVWRKHLWHHPDKKPLVDVFGRMPPWKIVRWINALHSLVGCCGCEEAITILSDNLWNGFCSDEWAFRHWNAVRKPRKVRKEHNEHKEFHRPRFRLCVA